MAGQRPPRPDGRGIPTPGPVGPSRQAAGTRDAPVPQQTSRTRAPAARSSRFTVAAPNRSQDPSAGSSKVSAAALCVRRAFSSSARPALRDRGAEAAVPAALALGDASEKAGGQGPVRARCARQADRAGTVGRRAVHARARGRRVGRRGAGLSRRGLPVRGCRPGGARRAAVPPVRPDASSASTCSRRPGTAPVSPTSPPTPAPSSVRLPATTSSSAHQAGTTTATPTSSTCSWPNGSRWWPSPSAARHPRTSPYELSAAVPAAELVERLVGQARAALDVATGRMGGPA